MHNKLLVDREVVEQALAALEYDGLLKKRQAITSLRAALAQKPEPAQAMQDAAVYGVGISRAVERKVRG